VTYSRANVPLPALVFAYHAVAEAHPDAPALSLAASILSEGESSRLYRILVYQRQIAESVSVDDDFREQPGLFEFTVRLNEGKSLQQTERILNREIRRMQTSLVTPAELERAKTQQLTSLVRGREENEERALDLVQTTLIEGDPNRMNTEAKRIQAVTARDIRRVMRTYLQPSNRTVVHYLPESMDPAKRKKPGTKSTSQRTPASPSQAARGGSR
jgi:zinc protease